MEVLTVVVLWIAGIAIYGGGFFILYVFPGYCAYKLSKKELPERPESTIFLGALHSIISILYLAYLIVQYWGRFAELGMWGVIFAIPFQIPSLILVLVLAGKYSRGTSNKSKQQGPSGGTR